ncbi:hypothetical protein ABIE27_000352 [Paenibacillus sp. 4624]|uniref:hypothetical protein n=1 Tax=Paenibacillus sp. 4624 TaxID=3156453 RepID=UPI003D1CC596
MSKQEEIKFMLGMPNEDFGLWVDAGEYSDQNVIDLHGEALRLLNELDKATTLIGQQAMAMNRLQNLANRQGKELGEARYALNAIQMGEWACTHDNHGLEVWTTRRINPGQIAREALGQEGEGNQDA